MKSLVVATGNPGKAKEFAHMLGMPIQCLADFPEIVMPPEEGETFEANARTKAEFVSQALNVPVLADDSGLAVDALDGAPGVRSARFAPGSDADRVDHLLAVLRDIPPEARTARFVCALAFAAPGQSTILRQGTLEGQIAATPRGAGGFGYDPVFEVPGRSRTAAELTREEKSEISHRGRALEAMRSVLERYFSLEVDSGSP